MTASGGGEEREHSQVKLVEERMLEYNVTVIVFRYQLQSVESVSTNSLAVVSCRGFVIGKRWHSINCIL